MKQDFRPANIMVISATIALAMACVVPVAKATKQVTLELFGTPLKNADRDTLRVVFKKAGLGIVRDDDDSYWADVYDPSGVLSGASRLAVFYTMANRRFSHAEYTFPSHVNPQQVKNIVDMVSRKYGSPSSKSGNYGLGNVKVVWNTGNGMQVEVYRGWPDTTTYMSLIDSKALKQQQAEVRAEEERQKAEKSAAQSAAF